MYDPMERVIDWFSRSCIQEITEQLRHRQAPQSLDDPEEMLLQALTEKYEMEPDIRWVVTLYRAGFTLQEIAEKRGKSTKWVWNRLKKAKKHF